MKEKKDCKIIQDLLPNYIDNLTNEETNAYIEKHLEQCEECKKIYDDMKKKIEIELEKPDRREIKFFKKYKNKLRFLRIILLIIFMIFVLNSCRKIIIISDLSNKAEQYVDSTNFHKVSIFGTYTNDFEGFTKMEVYRLGDKRKVVIRDYIPSDEIQQVVTMFGKDRKINFQNKEEYTTNMYVIENGKKTKAMLNQQMALNAKPENILKLESLWQQIFGSIFASIGETNYNGEKCYYIANFGLLQNTNSYGMYISKDTGLVVGFGQVAPVGEIESSLQTYKYEFDTVTEEDFVEPDASEYENVVNEIKD